MHYIMKCAKHGVSKVDHTSKCMTSLAILIAIDSMMQLTGQNRFTMSFSGSYKMTEQCTSY